MSTPADLAKLSRSMGWRTARRRDIVKTYARRNKAGFPITCTSAAKIIYDSREAARDCAEQLLRELDDALYQWPYQCVYSSKGHWHLTSTHHPATD